MSGEGVGRVDSWWPAVITSAGVLVGSFVVTVLVLQLRPSVPIAFTLVACNGVLAGSWALAVHAAWRRLHSSDDPTGGSDVR